MVSLCFYFQVHQPDRLREYRTFEIGKSPFYLHESKNNFIMRKVANKCYLPMTNLLKRLIAETNGAFKCAFSFSGVFLEQCERFAPDVLKAFQDLVATGNVEVLAETHHHSLTFLYSLAEWKTQIAQHAATVKRLFGVEPQIFRNTELIYANWIGEQVADMGYKAMLAEGVDWNLGWRSPNYIYNNPNKTDLRLLLKNYRLSDDIAFRFSNRNWDQWPLMAERYIDWLDFAGLDGQVVNLFMDYETFGEHQWADSGIFDFMASMVHMSLGRGHHNFVTPSEAIQKYPIVGTYQAEQLTSWADSERDLSAWRSNRMQEDALSKLYALEAPVKAINDEELLTIWRRLTTSDHFYYMCTKYYADGDVHSYFSPFETPYDAYINFMNVLNDLELRIAEQATSSPITKITSKANYSVSAKKLSRHINSNPSADLLEANASAGS